MLKSVITNDCSPSVNFKVGDIVQCNDVTGSNILLIVTHIDSDNNVFNGFCFRDVTCCGPNWCGRNKPDLKICDYKKFYGSVVLMND